MRDPQFRSWLSEATQHPILEALKTALAALLLLGLLGGVVAGVRGCRGQQRQLEAESRRLEQQNGYAPKG